MVLDYPIREFDKFVATVGLRMHHFNFAGFSFMVANEASSIYAVLYAAGYSAMEIIALRASGELDPVSLIEGKQKLPDALHVQKKGANHKGIRLRDKLNELLRRKIPGAPNAPVSLAELRQSGRRMNLHITVLSMATSEVVTLSASTHPAMPAADAALASCAVQPYIRVVSYKDPNKPETTLYGSCSNVLTFPAKIAEKLFKDLKLSGNFSQQFEGYGHSGDSSSAGSTRASGSDILKVLLSKRAPAYIADTIRQHTFLF